MENLLKKAVIVDCNYGSVTLEGQENLKKQLAECGISLDLVHCKNEDEIIEAARGAEMILGTGNPPVSAKVIAALPKLKAVLRFGIGVNSVDLDAATEKGVAVMFMPGFCINELAVHATALALSLDRNVVYYDSRIRKGKWPKAQYYAPRAPKDLVLGLYGFGGSAKELYKIWHDGFGSRVITHDPYVKKDMLTQYDVELVDFDTLVRECDILSIHVPLTPETRHSINMDVFKKMKNTAMVINISRGGMINEADLAEALKTGEIRFAGLDVYENEPVSADSPLLGMDNVVLTCHSAFYGEASRERQLAWAFEMTRDFMNNRKIQAGKLANRDVIGKLADYEFI